VPEILDLSSSQAMCMDLGLEMILERQARYAEVSVGAEQQGSVATTGVGAEVDGG